MHKNVNFVLQFKQKRLKMKQDSQKYFWIGTVFLFLAMMVLTVLPIFVSQYISIIYIKIKDYITIATTLFIVALIFYFLSKETLKKQVVAILIAYIYFYIFINFFAD